MSNDSRSGGYLTPPAPAPGGLTFDQFLQQMFAGISGFAGALVRPRFQIDPPKSPDQYTDWMSFGIGQIIKDQYAATGLNSAGIYSVNRHEQIPIDVAFYGPNSRENASIFADGFMVTQNRDALKAASMGYQSVSAIIRGPDLVNQVWVDRYELTLTFTRQVLRTYPVLSFASVAGMIQTDKGQPYITVPISVTTPNG